VCDPVALSIPRMRSTHSLRSWGIDSVRFCECALITVVLVTIRTSPAWADTSRIITIRDATEIALERDPALRQLEIDARLGQIGVDQAKMGFLPNLGVNMSGAKSFGYNYDTVVGTYINQAARSLSVLGSTEMNLFNGFRDLASVRQAKFGMKAADHDVARMKEAVVFEAASNFLNLSQRAEFLRVQRDNLAAQSKLESQLQQYVSAGARAVADLYLQQSYVAAARVAVIEAESAVELSQSDLVRFLQLDPAGVYDFQIPAESDGEFVADQMLLKDLIQSAVVKRVDLRAQRDRVDAAHQAIVIANAGHWPSLTLGAGYGTAYTSVTPTGLSDQLDAQRGGSVVLELVIPLYDRSATINATRRARLEEERARVELQSMEEEVGVQVRNGYIGYLAAKKGLAAALEQKQVAERATDASIDRYKAGVGTLLEVADARSGFVLAETSVVRTRANLSFQRIQLQFALGDFRMADTRD
jgi:outer membrane protein